MWDEEVCSIKHDYSRAMRSGGCEWDAEQKEEDWRQRKQKWWGGKNANGSVIWNDEFEWNPKAKSKNEGHRGVRERLIE